MKYCAKCGKELFDEAVICVGCGCPVAGMYVPLQNAESEEVKQKRIKKRKKAIILSIVAVCVVACISVVASFAVKEIKKKNTIKEVIDQISGEKFLWSETTTYTYLGAISENNESFSFDDEGNCEEQYYFYNTYTETKIDNSYDRTYEIKLEKGNVYIVLSNKDRLKVKYEGEEIVALYDVKAKKSYVKKD